MEQPTEINNQPTTPEHSQPGSHLLVQVVAISLICGVLAGGAGGWYAASLQYKKSGTVQSTTQNGVYHEDSTIIGVVKKTSSAVVSVGIFKDVNLQQNFSASPFDQFFGYTPQAPSNAAPNIQQIGAGSGFFASSDGLVLTNKHVVADTSASYKVITNDGKSYAATVVARDPVNDLAILKIQISGAPTLSLADSSQVQLGQQVVAIGDSLGQYENTVTSGIVSGIGRSITAGGEGTSEQLEGLIQTDAAINPGNSGGPLLNFAGQVIGINTAIDQQGQSIGFAIPANDAAKALASYQKSGRIMRPFLGVRYVIVTADLATQEKLPRNYGALIIGGQTAADVSVVAGSPAALAGLVENDIILEINGSKIDENNTLSKELKNFNVGDTIQMKIYHQGNEKTVAVTLAEAK